MSDFAEIQSCVEILGVGVDTLVLNIYPTDSSFKVVKRRVDPELQEELTLLKQRAQDEEEDIETRFAFEGVKLLMKTKGSEGFNWILRNRKLTLAVNRGSKMQLLGQVRCSSEYLWSVLDREGKQDLGQVIYDVHIFLMSIFGEYIILQPSAVDLAVDVVNLNLGTREDIKEHFITRAQLDDEMPVDSKDDDGMIDGPESIKRRWRRITGLPFGARNGALSALLYDKTHEIKYKSQEKEWFCDLWRREKQEDGTPVWDGVSPVWRIELRLKRRALHEFKQEGVFHGIEDAYDLMERIPGMWAYAVGHAGGAADGLPDGWLRYVVPTEDTNRSRWPVHPDWQVIQGAFVPEVIPETEYEREQREREDLLQEVDAEREVRPMVATYTEKSHRRRMAAPATSPDVVAAPAEPVSFDLKPFIRKRHYEVNMRRMVAQILGCSITAEAWRPQADERLGVDVAPDLSYTFHFLHNLAEDYLQEKERDFAQLVQKKRVLYSVETVA